MKTSLLHHATIALLASACALDFSWPLDLVTTCETDAHCPEGLVCRFNSCGRDAVGKDGEPCNLDGRCEEGLLCDEIACRASRNNEPVPEWVVTASASKQPFDISLAVADGGRRLLWGAQVSGRTRVGDLAVQQDDGSPCLGTCLAVADVAAAGTVEGTRSLELPEAYLGTTRPAGGVLGVASDGATVVAHYAIDPNEFVGARHVVIERLDPSGGAVRRLADESTEGEQYDDLRVGWTSTDRALVSYSHSPILFDSDLEHRTDIDEYALNGTRIRGWSWSWDHRSAFGVAVRALDAGRQPPVALLESDPATLLGLPGDGAVLAVVELLAGGASRVIGRLEAESVAQANLVHAPDGRMLVCFTHVDTVEVTDPAGGHRAVPVRGDGISGSVVRFDDERGVTSATLPFNGVTSIHSCAVLSDGTTVVSGFSVGDDPVNPVRATDADDRDLLLVGLDAALAPVWTIRHGDTGNQEGHRVLPVDGGFVVTGTFGSTLNLGLGTYRSVSGGDAFLARYRVPAP